MYPKQFQGTLTQGAVIDTLYHMLISQEVFSKNINLKGTLVEKFRVDGTLYGDTKLYISTDVGLVYDFADKTKTLLTKVEGPEPRTQAIKVEKFKQTAITVDGVRLKQAFMSADIYLSFTSVVIQWLRDAMKVLNVTMINAFIGTIVSEATKAEIDIEFPALAASASVSEIRQYNSYQAELIGEALADVSVDLQDALRDYNDYNFLRAYNLSDFMIVWNKKWANKIKHISLPKIFHKDEVIGKEMENITINDRYFGDVIATAGTSDGKVRTLVDMVYENVEEEEVQLFPGDIIPTGITYKAFEAYTQNNAIIGKIVHKRAVPFMSAMVVESEFYNPKDLDRTHFLTWGYSEPTYLAEYPLITFKAKYAVEDEG